jgi:hypothetical protein
MNREAGGRVANFFPDSNSSPDFIDILDRNIIAVRPGESVEAMDGLITKIRSYLEPVPYERDI